MVNVDGKTSDPWDTSRDQEVGTQKRTGRGRVVTGVNREISPTGPATTNQGPLRPWRRRVETRSKRGGVKSHPDRGTPGRTGLSFSPVLDPRGSDTRGTSLPSRPVVRRVLEQTTRRTPTVRGP